MSRKRAVTLWGVLIVVASFAVFANNLGNEFVWDDPLFVRDNTIIRDLRNIPSFFTKPWAYSGANPGPYKRLGAIAWRPIAFVSYAVDYAVWGASPFGFHLTSNLLNSLACLLVFLLLLRLNLAVWAAGIGALYFALHAVHTEAVDVITYRTTLLASGFFLSGLLAHIHGRGDTCKRPWLFVRVIAPICYALACLSKESGMTLIAVIGLYDLAFKNHIPWRKRLVDYLPLLLVGLGYFWLRGQIVERTHFSFFLGKSGWEIFLTQFKVLRLNFSLMLLPYPQCAFYDWTILPAAKSFWELEVLAGMVLAVGLLAVGGLGLRRKGFVLFVSGWFVITLLPYVQIIPHFDVAGERFLYLASVAWAYGLARLVELVAQDPRPTRQRVAAILVGLMLCVYAGLTLNRNAQWRSTERMHEVTVDYFPFAVNSNWELGNLYFRRGAYKQAAKHYKRVSQVLPGLESARKMWQLAERRSRAR